MFLYFGHVYFFVWRKSKNNEKENVLQNEAKDLTFEVCNSSITFFLKKGLGISHVFVDSIDFKQQIYCSIFQVAVGQKISHFLWMS